jgi:hypothetical protein
VDVHNGFIVNPADYRAGMLYVSPFMPADAFTNKVLWQQYKGNAEPYLELNDKQHTVMPSATAALDAALTHLRLAPHDEVYIATTSGNSYISGCVTRTIEKHCRWSLSAGKHTAAVLVNHEFGFPYPNMAEIMAMKLPLIEDCAYAMYSMVDGKPVGSFGDYAIFSMAKMFPMQAGGLLCSKSKMVIDHSLSVDAVRYFKACFNHYHALADQIIEKRIAAYRHLSTAFASIGFDARFQMSAGDVPGAFLFHTKNVDLPGLKLFMQRQGVECSVFYGEEAFFVPCHQQMDKQHIEYLLTLVSTYLA